MKSIRFRFLVAAMAVLLGTAIAKSQSSDAAPATPPAAPAHAYGHGMHGHMMGFWAKQLNLTDEQKTQFKTIMQKERPAMKPLYQQSHQIELQMRQFSEGTYDEAKVRTLATQKAQLQAELEVQKTRIHNEMFQILTADQQAKMKEIEARHEARMQERMQKAPAAPSEE
jgi:periplasmic protein CpxP/Spy